MDVKVGVAVGVVKSDVCVAAALAVSTIDVLIEFGSKVGIGVAADANAGAQARRTIAAVIRKITFF
jgi:hypothetical protein